MCSSDLNQINSGKCKNNGYSCFRCYNYRLLITINLGIHHADEHDADIINLSLAPPNYKEGKHSTSMTLFYYVHSTHKTKNKKTAGDVLSLTAKNYSFISLLFCRLLCTFCIYILVHIVYQLVQTIGKMYVFQSHIIRYF